MKKVLILILGIALTITAALAAKMPADVQGYLIKNIPDIDIRFDGVIILPDGTVYLPLYPASFKKPEKLEIVETYPKNTSITNKPDAVIFNNDFVLLKVITNSNGKKTILRFEKPPVQVKTGILPQDMLVPNGLIIPENVKGIIGNLDIQLTPEQDIKVAADVNTSAKIPEINKTAKKHSNIATIPQLKDKSLYMVTSYSKNISVVSGESLKADYALSQVSTPIDAKLTLDNKFLLVTAYDSTLVNIISIADDRIIKQIDLTTQGGEIVMDTFNNKAYIASPAASAIYVIDINSMTLSQRIKINGRCEKLTLNDKYLMYVDKYSDSIWSIELNNNYNLRNLGKFPNISKITYNNGFVYLTSRTKNRVAVLNYETKQLITEFETVEKPVDMMVYENSLYVLGAKDNQIQVINLSDNEPAGIINIGGEGFATKFCPIPNSNLVIITDTKLGQYTIVDLQKNKVVKTNGTELPVSNVIIGKKVKKIN
ncbi:MAG: hypothetical protein NC200_01895 [Candidatus Gastranaerophilales bacterium]|nr:hypothetical protein [Candidatus Gastranaerophilales bacterium]